MANSRMRVPDHALVERVPVSDAFGAAAFAVGGKCDKNRRSDNFVRGGEYLVMRGGEYLVFCS